MKLFIADRISSRLSRSTEMKKRFLTPFSLLLAGVLMSLACTNTARAATLARDGKVAAIIVVAPDAQDATRQAATDLAHYLKTVTGQKFEITTKVPADAGADANQLARIWVGDHPAMDRLLAGKFAALEKSEEVHIQAMADDLVIRGRDVVIDGHQVESGTAMAVYTFAQKYLAIRWLWPGELGFDAPSRPTLVFEPFTYRDAPILHERQLRMPAYQTQLQRYFRNSPAPDFLEASTLHDMNEKTLDWRRFQRMPPGYQHRPTWHGGAHAFMYWWKNFRESHPQVFALQRDGRRIPDPPIGTRAKICVSNPDTVALWMKTAEEQLEKRPWDMFLGAMPNDSAYRGECMCEDCQALDAPNGEKVTLSSLGQSYEHVSLTDRYVYFWNKLGEAVEARWPGKQIYIGAGAYGPYTAPPVQRSLRDNISIVYVGNMTTASDEKRAVSRGQWKEWSNKASLMIWRPNIFHESTVGYLGMPVIATKRLADDMQFLAKHDMVGIDIDSSFLHWATQGPMYYLIVQMSWNPNADAAAIMDDYYQRGFGPAASKVRAYYDLLEEAFVDSLNQDYRDRGDIIAHFGRIYSPQLLAEAEALLDEANALVADGDEKFARRIAFVKLGLDFMRSTIRVSDAMLALRMGKGKSMQQLIRDANDAYQQHLKVLQSTYTTFAISPVHALAWTNQRSLNGYLGPVDPAYLALMEEDDNIINLPTQWDFKTDPRKMGVEQQWHASAVDSSDWPKLLITAWWGEQLTNDDPVDPEPVNYMGDAWYRTTFTKPDMTPGQRLILHFGAVDESCSVYVNGQLISEQTFDANLNPEAWQQPRRFDITHALQPGQNLIAVKVQSLSGAGGIWRGAYLRITQPVIKLTPLVTHERQPSPWQIRDRKTNERLSLDQDALQSSTPKQVGQLEVTSTHGQYVDEPAVTITKKHEDLADLIVTVRKPVPAGRYLVRLRYQFQPASGSGDESYISLRVATRQNEQRENHWIAIPKQGTSTWAIASDQLELTGDAQEVTFTMFLRGKGQYTVDEIMMEPVGHAEEAASP